MSQQSSHTTFPRPNEQALAHCQQMLAHLQQRIDLAGGKLSFTDYMQQVLYAPNLGYYSANNQKFGKHGDFVTAPELSPLFSQCVAKQCLQVLKQFKQAVILELGAGSGIMAATILKFLAEQQALPEHYYILDLSAELKQRQKLTLQQHCPELLDRVTWLDALPEQPINGVILANEVLDAMPVHRFELKSGKINECFVDIADQTLKASWQPSNNQQLIEQASKLFEQLPTEVTEAGYQSEINLSANPWIKSLSQTLQAGLILLIDYGYVQQEYFHPQRDQGTLMCHYQQLAHSDPFLYPGLQDLTAHVNFTQIAENADSHGLHVAGYSSQAMFLIACGLLEFTQGDLTTAEQHQINQQIKYLTLPSEMGERFKVMGLIQGELEPLLGFQMQDLRCRL